MPVHAHLGDLAVFGLTKERTANINHLTCPAAAESALVFRRKPGTGGEDLTLFEVQDALTQLQSQTGLQTEIVMGVINRRKQKDFKTTKSDTPRAQSQTQTVVSKQTAAYTCPRCNSPMKATDIYCKVCGEKLEGRKGGNQTYTSRQNTCEFCGANLRPGAQFCTNCGSNIK